MGSSEDAEWPTVVDGEANNLGRPIASAVDVRNTFVDFFNNEGAIEWQENVV